FAQLLGETIVVALQLLHLFSDRIALGLRAALLRSQPLKNASGSLASPGRDQGRVQSFPAQQRSDSAGALGAVGFRKDALFVIGSEAAALGLSHDFRIGMGVE